MLAPPWRSPIVRNTVSNRWKRAQSPHTRVIASRYCPVFYINLISRTHTPPYRKRKKNSRADRKRTDPGELGRLGRLGRITHARWGGGVDTAFFFFCVFGALRTRFRLPP